MVLLYILNLAPMLTKLHPSSSPNPLSNSSLSPFNDPSANQLPSNIINTSSDNLSELQPTLPESSSCHPDESQSKISKSWVRCGQRLELYVINARSLVNKLTKFQSLAYLSSPSVIAVTETWLLHSVFDNEILPNGYSIFCKDRSSHCGGVLQAVARYLPTRFFSSPTDVRSFICTDSVKLFHQHFCGVCPSTR